MTPACPKPTKKIKLKKRINKVSKKDRTKWKNKAINLAKKIVRERINECERCGKKSGKFDGAHILPVRYAATAAEIDNILCLCAGCHTFSNDSCHRNPVSFTRWLDSYAPGRYERLLEKVRSTTQLSAEDWKLKYEALKKTAEENGIEV